MTFNGYPYIPFGVPDPEKPVQEQYDGDWEVCAYPNNDPRIGQLLSKHVLDAFNAAK